MTQSKNHASRRCLYSHIYALAIDYGGPISERHDAASGGDPRIDQAQAKFVHVQMTAPMAPMDYFAYRLSQFMDLPVVNLTGLEGGYDFKLEFTRDLPPGFPPDGKINGEERYTSV